MGAYLCFNDESGFWSDKKSKIYVRASLVVDVEDIKNIENAIIKIREKYNLNELNSEIKWQDLWQLRNFFKQKKAPKDKHLSEIYNFINNKQKDHHLLINYCKEVLSILSNYDVKIILTFTNKEKSSSCTESNVYKFHIQNHLQRLQMQYQSKKNTLIILIYDSIDEKRKKEFKQIYNEIISQGDFIKEYTCIANSLLFDDSYDNKFLQLTDFIAGCFRGVLSSINRNNQNNYQVALDCFKNIIFQKLARKKDSEIFGVGIMEIPTNKNIRKYYKTNLENLVR